MAFVMHASHPNSLFYFKHFIVYPHQKKKKKKKYVFKKVDPLKILLNKALIKQFHSDNTSLCIDYTLESCEFTVILFGSMLPNLKGHSLKRLE